MKKKEIEMKYWKRVRKNFEEEKKWLKWKKDNEEVSVY